MRVPPAKPRDPLSLKVALCLCCAPGGAALLAKVYGVAPMQSVVLWFALPGAAVVVACWLWAARRGREAATLLWVGAVGGMLGSLGYDAARVPFALAGQRIYAPIDAFGLWLLEADASSRYTEAAGWAYHYFNGVTFGVMYALFMRGRHWAWAVAWAFALETAAVLSPFGRIFGLSGNPSALFVAYLGHVAYGLPLGWLVFRTDVVREWAAAFSPHFKLLPLVLGGAALVGHLTSPEIVGRDARAASGEFRVEGRVLNPGWLRVERGAQVRVYNPEPSAVTVRVKQQQLTARVAGGGRQPLSFPAPGIYQVFVETDGQSRSSFVIVEPVEDVR